MIAEALLVKVTKNWIKVMLRVRVGVSWKLLNRMINNRRLLMTEGNQQIYVTSVALVIKRQVTPLKGLIKRLQVKPSSIETKTNSNLTLQRRILNHETNLLMFSPVTQNIAILWIVPLSRKTKGLLQCQLVSLKSHQTETYVTQEVLILMEVTAISRKQNQALKADMMEQLTVRSRD